MRTFTEVEVETDEDEVGRHDRIADHSGSRIHCSEHTSVDRIHDQSHEHGVRSRNRTIN